MIKEREMTRHAPEDPSPVEWGDDSLLRIEEDLDGLEEAGDGEQGGDGSGGGLIVEETELEEWEEIIDSQWVKLIE